MGCKGVAGGDLCGGGGGAQLLCCQFMQASRQQLAVSVAFV